jgi:hypothetical protein
MARIASRPSTRLACCGSGRNAVASAASNGRISSTLRRLNAPMKRCTTSSGVSHGEVDVQNMKRVATAAAARVLIRLN